MRVPCMHMARINVRVKVIFSVTVRVYNMAGYGHVHKLSKQASIFICPSDKQRYNISMNNIQGQAARKAHKAQHCWPPCQKNSKLKKNKQTYIHTYTN